MKRYTLVTRVTTVVCLLVCLLTASMQAAVGPVITMKMQGIIASPNQSYFDRVLDIAKSKHASLVVVELDTPGGLMDSMEGIVKSMLQSPVPVAVYVSPGGAKAGSAGTFITIAAHIAAMAPGTSIGAAHPVNGDGGDIQGEMNRKVTNYASSYIRTLAQLRGRNADWAEKAVRQSVAIDNDTAIKYHVVDVVAIDVTELLRKVEGRKVKVQNNTVTISTRGASIESYDMLSREKLFNFLANPNVLAILGVLTMYGLIAELQNPGAVLPGTIGVISLVLVLLGGSVLPVSIAGVSLLIVAAALFVIDAFSPTHGVLTTGGVISMCLGLLMVFDSSDPAVRVSIQTALTLSIMTGFFFMFVVVAGLRALKAKPQSGKETLIGKMAVASSDIAPTGRIFFDGTYWNARTDGSVISEGEEVTVERLEGLTVVVTKQTKRSDQ